MQRSFVPAAVAALALAAAPAAGAKEITKAEVCGADGCSTAAAADREVLGNGGPSRTPPTAAPFYMVRIEVDHGGGQPVRWEMTAVPERRALRAEDGCGWRCHPRWPPSSRSSPRAGAGSRPRA